MGTGAHGSSTVPTTTFTNPLLLIVCRDYLLGTLVDTSSSVPASPLRLTRSKIWGPSTQAFCQTRKTPHVVYNSPKAPNPTSQTRLLFLAPYSPDIPSVIHELVSPSLIRAYTLRPRHHVSGTDHTFLLAHHRLGSHARAHAHTRAHAHAHVHPFPPALLPQPGIYRV